MEDVDSDQNKATVELPGYREKEVHERASRWDLGMGKEMQVHSSMMSSIVGHSFLSVETEEEP